MVVERPELCYIPDKMFDVNALIVYKSKVILTPTLESQSIHGRVVKAKAFYILVQMSIKDSAKTVNKPFRALNIKLTRVLS